MYREITIPEFNEITIKIPQKYVNKKIEVVISPVDDLNISEKNNEIVDEKLIEFDNLWLETQKIEVAYVENSELNNMMNEINI